MKGKKIITKSIVKLIILFMILIVLSCYFVFDNPNFSVTPRVILILFSIFMSILLVILIVLSFNKNCFVRVNAHGICHENFWGKQGLFLEWENLISVNEVMYTNRDMRYENMGTDIILLDFGIRMLYNEKTQYGKFIYFGRKNTPSQLKLHPEQKYFNYDMNLSIRIPNSRDFRRNGKRVLSKIYEVISEREDVLRKFNNLSSDYTPKSLLR